MRFFLATCLLATIAATLVAAPLEAPPRPLRTRPPSVSKPIEPNSRSGTPNGPRSPHPADLRPTGVEEEEVIKSRTVDKEYNKTESHPLLSRILNFKSAFRATVDQSSQPRFCHEPALLVILPNEEAFANIFGHSPSEGDWETIKSAKTSAEKEQAELIELVTHGRERIQELLKRAAKNGCGVVGIVGHSLTENGSQVFVLPDGTKISWNEIAQMGAREGLQTIALTCFSEDLGLKIPISYKDAFDMWQQGIQAWRTADSIGEGGKAKDNKFINASGDAWEKGRSTKLHMSLCRQISGPIVDQNCEFAIYQALRPRPRGWLVEVIVIAGTSWLLSYEMSRKKLITMSSRSAANLKGAFRDALAVRMQSRGFRAVMFAWASIVSGGYYLYVSERLYDRLPAIFPSRSIIDWELAYVAVSLVLILIVQRVAPKHALLGRLASMCCGALSGLVPGMLGILFYGAIVYLIPLSISAVFTLYLRGVEDALRIFTEDAASFTDGSVNCYYWIAFAFLGGVGGATYGAVKGFNGNQFSFFDVFSKVFPSESH